MPNYFNMIYLGILYKDSCIFLYVFLHSTYGFDKNANSL